MAWKRSRVQVPYGPHMVIFVGGLIGTGKTSLAQALGESLGIFYYDVDLIKKEVYPTDPNYNYNIENSIPFSNEIRIRNFELVSDDFVKLSRNHENIIVDETLHKESLRQILFKAAKRHFGGYIVIWIRTDEKIIKERLLNKQREGHMLKNPFEMYLALKKEFEDLNDADIIFNNNNPLDVSVPEFIRVVSEKLRFKNE